MIVNLLVEHSLEFFSLKGGCRGSWESTIVKMSYCWTIVKMSYCWKSHDAANFICDFRPKAVLDVIVNLP